LNHVLPGIRQTNVRDGKTDISMKYDMRFIWGVNRIIACGSNNAEFVYIIKLAMKWLIGLTCRDCGL
jgi:hypothetical protein